MISPVAHMRRPEISTKPRGWAFWSPMTVTAADAVTTTQVPCKVHVMRNQKKSFFMALKRLSVPTVRTRDERKVPNRAAHTITAHARATSSAPMERFDITTDMSVTETKVADPIKSKNRSDCRRQANAKAIHCKTNAIPAATSKVGNCPSLQVRPTPPKTNTAAKPSPNTIPRSDVFLLTGSI